MTGLINGTRDGNVCERFVAWFSRVGSASPRSNGAVFLVLRLNSGRRSSVVGKYER
jgi:hypothetical protein